MPSQRSFRKLQDYPGVFRAWAAGIPEITVSVGASLSAACSICILGALVGFSDVAAWAGRSIFLAGRRRFEGTHLTPGGSGGGAGRWTP